MQGSGQHQEEELHPLPANFSREQPHLPPQYPPLHSGDKKVEIYELLSQQKTKLRQKRAVSRKKNKGEEGKVKGEEVEEIVP